MRVFISWLKWVLFDYNFLFLSSFIVCFLHYRGTWCKSQKKKKYFKPFFLNCLFSKHNITKKLCSTQVNFTMAKQQFPWWLCSHCEKHQHTCFVYQARSISHLLGLFPTVIKAEDSKTAFHLEDKTTKWTQHLLKLWYQFLFALYSNVSSDSYISSGLRVLRHWSSKQKSTRQQIKIAESTALCKAP